MLFLLSKGYRVVAFDRRGHGRSDQSDTGNEMVTYGVDPTQLVHGGRWENCPRYGRVRQSDAHVS